MANKPGRVRRAVERTRDVAGGEKLPAEPVKVDALPLADGPSDRAPFIYFDGVPAFGLQGGLPHMTIQCARLVVRNGTTVAEGVTAAHLVMNIKGLLELRYALQQIELMLAPSPTAQSKPN